MVSVALVEDDYTIAKLEQDCIKNSWNINEALQVEIFKSAEQFLDRVKANKFFDILIADIELPGMNGIEMGMALRKCCSKTAIIFLTAHDGFALESYHLDAEQYILKSEMETRLPVILNRVGKRICENRKRYKFIATDGQIRKIDFDEIVYLSKDGKYVKYQLREGEARERTSLEMVLDEVGGFPFIKIERGYVVNARFVVRITSDMVWLKTGEKLPVSRRMLAKVKKEIALNGSRL
jgi:DNA-binding LytR/AlgR family response regulator